MVKTISQRELRNDNAEIMRGVEAGEEYTVTRRGVPVARLVPATPGSDLRCDRPAKHRPSYVGRKRALADETSEQILDDLRGNR
jgi:prevent-host-death family protein